MPKRPLPIIKDHQVQGVEAPKSLPAKWDWRTDGLINGVSAISAVNNQGYCGSCWAFSATEEIESMNFLDKTSTDKGKPWNLAVQQIVDCAHKALGCQGGWTYIAYEYVEKAGGMDPTSDYPYTARNGACHFKKSEVKADISTWKYVTKDRDEEAMKHFVATTGPLSVCVDAASWQFYTKGVLRRCGKQIDHCVQLTGYGEKDGVQAWNIRNSWGLTWGEKGYIYLLYGKNTCAVAEVATYVHGKK